MLPYTRNIADPAAGACRTHAQQPHHNILLALPLICVPLPPHATTAQPGARAPTFPTYRAPPAMPVVRGSACRRAFGSRGAHAFAFKRYSLRLAAVALPHTPLRPLPRRYLPRFANWLFRRLFYYVDARPFYCHLLHYSRRLLRRWFGTPVHCELVTL